MNINANPHFRLTLTYVGKVALRVAVPQPNFNNASMTIIKNLVV